MLDDTEDIALNFGDESAGKKKRFKYVKLMKDILLFCFSNWRNY